MENNRFNSELTKAIPQLMNHALSLTMDVEWAEELIQDASLKALLNINSYKADKNFTGWIYRIMYNIYVDDCKKRRNTFVDIEAICNEENENCQTIDVSYVDTTCNVNEIMGIVATLSEEYKSAFTMYLDGHKYNEIACKLSLPVGTVKRHIHIAREILKKKLIGYCI